MGIEIKATRGPLGEATARVHREEPGKVPVTFTLDGQDHDVWFAVSGAEPCEEADFLLPLTLFLAMARGARLRLPDPVSPRLLSAVPKIQDIFGLWCTEYWGGALENTRHVPVDARAREGLAEGGSGVGCFFSGGVDSFYTLLKHVDEITHIIFVHGFDISLEDQELREQASRMAREVANGLGKTLIEVQTNVREITRPEVGWRQYHGAALASVALLFQNLFRKVLVAATYSYADPYPLGSHPLLDPLWSTELTEIEHDGAEGTRLDKAAYITHHELAMRWLRVCLVNPNSAYNCGACQKCLRTMVVLRAVGALERCETLPSELDLDKVASTYVPDGQVGARAILRILERLGNEPELARALAAGIATSEAMELENEDQLRQRLSVQRRTLDDTRARLGASRKSTQRLKDRARKLEARAERVAEQNRRLAAEGSRLRYKVADAFAEATLKVPGIRNLAERRRSDGDG